MFHEIVDRLHLKSRLYSVSIGGEYESIVLDGPIFRKMIEIIQSETRFDNNRGELIINKVKVIKKK